MCACVAALRHRLLHTSRGVCPALTHHKPRHESRQRHLQLQRGLHRPRWRRLHSVCGGQVQDRARPRRLHRLPRRQLLVCRRRYGLRRLQRLPGALLLPRGYCCMSASRVWGKGVGSMWDARHVATSVMTLMVVEAGASCEARVVGMCRMFARVCAAPLGGRGSMSTKPHHMDVI